MNIVSLNENNTLSRQTKINMLSDFANTIHEESTRYDKNAAEIASIISKKRSAPKNNRESKSIIKDFLDNMDLETLSTIFLLAGTVITTIVKLYRNIRKLNENDLILGYVELSNEDLVNLNENQDFNEDELSEINDLKIAKVLDDQSNQFDFSSGLKMETINSLKLSDMKFSLKWHKDNTNSEEEFLNSVSLFLSTCQQEFKDDDELRLRKHYQRYLNK